MAGDNRSVALPDKPGNERRPFWRQLACIPIKPPRRKAKKQKGVRATQTQVIGHKLVEDALNDRWATEKQQGNDEAGHQATATLSVSCERQQEKNEDQLQSAPKQNEDDGKDDSAVINQMLVPDEAHEAAHQHHATHEETVFRSPRGENEPLEKITDVESRKVNATKPTTDHLHIDGAKASPNRRRIFENEVSERFFLEKPDEYSETDVMASCGSLSSRINSLTEYLIREMSRGQGSKQTDGYANGIHDARDGITERVLQLVRKVLGDRLYEELADTSKDADRSLALDAAVQDGLDAWSVSCMHLAMKPMLFGLRLRTSSEIEEIFRRMVDYEPELAQSWNRIRLENHPSDVDPHIKSLVSDICVLTEARTEDENTYANLEEVYRRQEAKDELQIALHWRALLHKHELELPSYKEAEAGAISQTEEIYRRGLLQVFAIAGVEPPTLSDNLLEMTSKIVNEAATLAECLKTAVFSQRVETVIVEPGEVFDNRSMRSADKGNSGTVKCTIQLGLEAIDTQRKRKLLVMPEVLLA